MKPQIDELIRLKAEYTCFNGRRTLSRSESGAPAHQRVPGGVVLRDPDHPDDDYLNRLSIQAQALGSQLTAVERPLAVEVFSEKSEDQPSLADQGYKMDHDLLFLGVDPAKLRCVGEPEIETVCVEQDQRPNFLAEVCRTSGKEVAGEVLENKAHYYCSDTFRCYLALIDNQVAGIATLFIAEEFGWLANAFTFDEHRECGVQSALIRRRVEDAAALGVRYIVSDVEPETQSLRNLKRAGFELFAKSTVWVKA